MSKDPRLVKPVIILGAGGHARVLIEALRLTDCKILGAVDQARRSRDTWFGISVLDDDQFPRIFPPEAVDLVNGVGALPNEEARWLLADRMREQGYSFVQVIHSAAIVASDVVLGQGVQVMAGAVIQPGTFIGDDTIINTRAVVDHDCTIGGRCHISPGVTLSGDVKIGGGTHIGTGASVIQGISIGANSVIAAGSVVYRDIDSGTTFVQTRTPKTSRVE